jgi:cyclophilin family peptidyl-prolyl cis-trans isomerase
MGMPEGPKRETLFLNAPEYLAFSQNAFDQEPFTVANSFILAKSGLVNADDVRLKINGIIARQMIKAEQLKEEGKDYISNDPSVAADVMKSIIKTTKLVGLTNSQDLNNGSTFYITMKDAIVRLLQNYPYISEYVSSQIVHQKGLYTLDGKYNAVNYPADKYEQAKSKSYAHWVTERIKRDSRITSLEIKSEIFGEVVDPLEQIVASGDRPATRRWKIIKAVKQ